MPIETPSPEQAGAFGGALAALTVALAWVRKKKLINVRSVASLLGDPGSEKPEDGTMAALVKQATDAATSAAKAAQEAALASASNSGSLEQLTSQLSNLSTQVATADHNNARAFGRLEGHFDDLARNFDDLARRQAETEVHVAKLRERMDDTQRRLGMRLRASDTPTPGGIHAPRLGRDE